MIMQLMTEEETWLETKFSIPKKAPRYPSAEIIHAWTKVLSGDLGYEFDPSLTKAAVLFQAGYWFRVNGRLPLHALVADKGPRKGKFYGNGFDTAERDELTSCLTLLAIGMRGPRGSDPDEYQQEYDRRMDASPLFRKLGSTNTAAPAIFDFATFVPIQSQRSTPE